MNIIEAMKAVQNGKIVRTVGAHYTCAVLRHFEDVDCLAMWHDLKDMACITIPQIEGEWEIVTGDQLRAEIQEEKLRIKEMRRNLIDETEGSYQ